MHKDYLKNIEPLNSMLPSVNAIEVINLFAEGKSEADVQGLIRVDGIKLSKSLVSTVFSHIKLIEDTMIRMLNGTSIVYDPPMTFDDDGNETGLAFPAKKLPTNKTELMNNIMFVVGLDAGKFSNVYDADFTELTAQITKIVDNVIAAQSGTLDDLIAALKPE